MAVAGLRGTGDWGPDERPKNFREAITMMNPDGDTPLLGLSSRATGRKYVTDDPEFNWWCEPTTLIRLQVNGALGTSDSLIVVDSGDPDANDIGAHYGEATHLIPGDILMVEPAADSAADTAERLFVVAVHSPTSFTVSRGFAGTTPATIDNDAFLLHIGNTFAEGTAAPQATTRNPIKFSNKTQIFKTTYELTGTAEQTRTRTNNNVEMDKKRRSWDHAKAIEMALLWGRQSEGIGPNGKPQRTMDGLRHLIKHKTVLTNGWDLALASGGNNIMDAIEPAFKFSSRGGDTRVAFVGRGALNAINRAIITNAGGSAFQIQYGSKEKVYGFNFRELYFPSGRLLIKTHPLMSIHPIYTYGMYVLDFSNITYVPVRGRDTKSKDNVQADDEDVRRGLWQTECSLLVDMAGETMAYIGGFNTTFGS